MIMKILVVGLLLQLVIILVTIISKNEKIFIHASQIIAFASIGFGMILSGLMSGNVFRRTAVERKNERVKRLSRASTFILLGTPSIVALIIYYFFYK